MMHPMGEEPVHPDDPIVHGRRWREERDSFRQAALELHAEIRSAMNWIEMGAEPSVAYHHMRKIADKWGPVLAESESSD